MRKGRKKKDYTLEMNGEAVSLPASCFKPKVEIESYDDGRAPALDRIGKRLRRRKKPTILQEILNPPKKRRRKRRQRRKAEIGLPTLPPNFGELTGTPNFPQIGNLLGTALPIIGGALVAGLFNFKR